MTLAELWHDIAEQAITIDLAALRDTIRSTIDDGLRAIRYDSAGGRSADVSSHPERMALRDRRDPSEDDLRLIDHHESRFVAAVAELAMRSHSRGAPETWDEAVKDAHLLAEMDAIGILERIPGEKPAKWVHAAGDALHDLELIRRRHATRDADDWERSFTSDLDDNQCCRVCLRLRLRVKAHARGLCQGCWKLSQDSRRHTADGEPVDPPVELIEEFRRLGNVHGPAWKATRSRWLTSLGPEHATRCG